MREHYRMLRVVSILNQVIPRYGSRVITSNSNVTHQTLRTWSEFKTAWDGVHNFLVAGECVPFRFDFPPVERVVDELRKDEMVRITPGTPDSRLRMEDCRQVFRAMRLEEALRGPFALAHFRLSRFDVDGGLLQGFKNRALTPWQEALTRNGFTWDRCYPIIFISGKGCATNYHMDFSHVLAWQIHGNKRFCGLLDPDRWADESVRRNYKAGDFAKPPAVSDADAFCYSMQPGDVLWNAFLTPHWVEAGQGIAMSINLSHGGLRLHGRLCRNEQEIVDFRNANPDTAPKPIEGTY